MAKSAKSFLKGPVVSQVLRSMEEFYRKHADVYEKLSQCEDRNNKIMRSIAKVFDIRGKVILDIGCGTGRFTVPFARKAEKVYALDKTESMLRILRKKARKKGIRNIKAIRSGFGGIRLPKESVDMIFSSWSFPAHSPNWERDLGKLRKVLRKGGKFIVAESAPRGEFWEIRKKVLGSDFRKTVIPHVNRWLFRNGFKMIRMDVLIDFRTRKGVTDICRAFYGGDISGYLIGKNKTSFKTGMGLFYWKKNK